jgi:hypothetical protein
VSKSVMASSLGLVAWTPHPLEPRTSRVFFPPLGMLAVKRLQEQRRDARRRPRAVGGELPELGRLNRKEIAAGWPGAVHPLVRPMARPQLHRRRSHRRDFRFCEDCGHQIESVVDVRISIIGNGGNDEFDGVGGNDRLSG